MIEPTLALNLAYKNLPEPYTASPIKFRSQNVCQNYQSSEGSKLFCLIIYWPAAVGGINLVCPQAAKANI